MNGIRRIFHRSVLHTLWYGLITGAVTGIIVALFSVCGRIVIDFSFSFRYLAGNGALVVVCVLILAILCCFSVAVIQTLVPSSKGGGIPLAEGMARGMLRIKWLSTAAALVAGSLLSFLSGLPLGGEGPSVCLGAVAGDGVGDVAKKPTAVKRYLITGGASAGLAAAFNAPLMGLCFAFEETHRRFSAHILAAAFSAVIAAVAVSQGILYGFGQNPYLSSLGIGAGRVALGFLKLSPIVGIDILKLCGIALLLGIICAGLAVGFNRLIGLLSVLLGKIKLPFLRLLPAFITAAIFGLIIAETRGPGETALHHININTATYILFAILVMRMVATAVCSGAGATGGLFIPMIAIGGLIGTIAAKACVASGLTADYAPNIIMLCVGAFFAASVRAPITAIVMTMELTGSFYNLLPCVISVATAAIITDLTRTQPLYEKALYNLMETLPTSTNARDMTVCGKIPELSQIAFCRIRDVMWPYNSLVISLVRNGVSLVPDGETILLPDDKITIRAENVDPDYFLTRLEQCMTIDDPPPHEQAESGYFANARNKE
ncbi:MAG: chloride channel protein [Clostridiales bacterium]|nr:chloride channel protein [Clostridiales bacterium]